MRKHSPQIHCAIVTLCAILSGGLAAARADETDETKLRPQIERWLRDWRDPPSYQAEYVALNSLFGFPPTGGKYRRPPDDVKSQLFNRRLNYDSWESRLSALKGFIHSFLEDDPEPLIPIFRDALNDPHAEIRQEAVIAFGVAIELIQNPPRKKWDPVLTKRIERNREDLIEIITDQLVAKGLADEDSDVVHESFVQVKSRISPTRTHLRALDRVIAKKSIRFPGLRDNVKALQTEWRRKVYGDANTKPMPKLDVDPDDDPFRSR